MTTLTDVAGDTPGPDPTQPHGTRAAIARHERAREDLCDECRVERNRLARVYYQQRKERQQRTKGTS